LTKRDEKYFLRIEPLEKRKPVIKVGKPWLLDEDKRAIWNELSANVDNATSIYVWYHWNATYKNVDSVCSWLYVLQSKVHANRPGGEEPRGFWAFHQSQATNGPKEGRPELPWLWTGPEGSERRAYVQWQPSEPFFIDDHERRWRLIEATKAEREEQRLAIVNIFNLNRAHCAWLERIGHKDYIHVKAVIPAEGDVPIPELQEGTAIKFRLGPQQESSEEPASSTVERNDFVVDIETSADFVIEAKASMDPSADVSEEQRIMMEAERNLQPVDAQIDYLDQAGMTKSFGE
jgi:hypothetical protein